MLYTVDMVNSMGVLPPPLKLGAYVLDDCDKDTYGLQQAVDFIKGNNNTNCLFLISHHRPIFAYFRSFSKKHYKFIDNVYPVNLLGFDHMTFTTLVCSHNQ